MLTVALPSMWNCFVWIFFHCPPTIWVVVRATVSMLKFKVWYSLLCSSPTLYINKCLYLFFSKTCKSVYFILWITLFSDRKCFNRDFWEESVSCLSKCSCSLAFQQFQSEAPGCHCYLMPCQHQLICSHWFVTVRLAEYAVLCATATINICVVYRLILLMVTSDMHLRRNLQHSIGQRRTSISLFTRGIMLLHHRGFTSLLRRSTAFWRQMNTVLKSQNSMVKM